MVLTIAQMAGGGSSTALRGPPGRHFSTDSFRICKKDTTIIWCKLVSYQIWASNVAVADDGSQWRRQVCRLAQVVVGQSKSSKSA